MSGSGTLGGSTYYLNLDATNFNTGMATTAASAAAGVTAIGGSLNVLVQTVNNVTAASGNASGAIGGGGGVIGGITRGIVGSGGLVGAVASLATGVGLATVALQATRGVIDLLGEGVIGFNDQLDRSTISWEVFTHNAADAKAMVNELFDFSRRTPFTFTQVDQAARQLATFGVGLDEVNKKVELLGNVAAGTGRPLQNLSYEYGQMVTLFNSGDSFGRPARALQQFGALSAEGRDQLEKMRKEGATADEMIKVLDADFGRFGDQLQRQSRTFSGALTTVKDTVDSLLAIAGKGAFDSIKNAVVELSDVLSSDAGVKWATNIGVIIKVLVDGVALIANGLKEAYALISGGVVAFQILTLSAIEKVAEGLNSISGGRMQGVVDGVNALLTNARQSIQQSAGILNDAGKDVEKIWADLNGLKWEESGTEAGAKFRAGLKHGIDPDGALAADAAATATEYLKAVSSSIANLNPDQLTGLNKLSDFISSALTGAAASSKIKPDDVLQTIRPMLAAAIAGMHDDVNQGLQALQAVLPPDVFARVQAYVEALRDADNATHGLAIATEGLNAAQDRYTKTVADAKSAMDAAAQAEKAVETTRAANAATFDHRIEVQREALTDLQRLAQAAADSAASIIRSIQADIDALSETARQHQEEDKQLIKAADDEYKRRQTAQDEHEAAFQAILDGTTAKFLAQRDSVDDVTKAIIARYNAEYEGKLRTQQGDDERVTRLQREERARLLELDQRIFALRQQGHFAEADALQKQRDALKAQYDGQVDRAQQVAAVSKDKADEAADQIKKAAGDQKDVDTAATAAAAKDLQNVKDVAAAREAADAEAVRQAQVRLKNAQEEADAVARDYKAREDAINHNIDDINRQKVAQKERDDLAVLGAQAAKNIVDTIWTKAVADAKDNVTAAQGLVDLFKNQKTEADLLLTTLEKQTTEYSKQYQFALGILNAERARRGLDPVTTLEGTGVNTSPPAPQPDPRGSEEHGPGTQRPPQPQSAPAGGSSNGPASGGGATAGPANPHVVTPDAPGFVPTEARPWPDGTWWDPKNGPPPQGYELRDGDYIWWVGTGAPTNSGAPNMPGPSAKLPMAAYLMGSGGSVGAPMARTSLGTFAGGMGDMPAAAGGGRGDFRPNFDFSGMTVDSSDRAHQVQGLVVQGIRQAFSDYQANKQQSRVGRKI
jgi:hypothetical protein